MRCSGPEDAKHRTSLGKSTDVLPQKYGCFHQRMPMFSISEKPSLLPQFCHLRKGPPHKEQSESVKGCLFRTLLGTIQWNVAKKCFKTCIFLILYRRITQVSLNAFVKRNLFRFVLLYLHHKYYENGSKEIESVKGRYGREGSVKYMVVGKVRSQSGDCL